jgi:hypothetical protein
MIVIRDTASDVEVQYDPQSKEVSGDTAVLFRLSALVDSGAMIQPFNSHSSRHRASTKGSVVEAIATIRHAMRRFDPWNTEIVVERTGQDVLPEPVAPKKKALM